MNEPNRSVTTSAPTSTSQGFGDHLRQWRKEQGATLESLSQKLGISFNTLWRWERGKTHPSRLGKDRLRRWGFHEEA